MVSKSVQARVDRMNNGLPTHDLAPGYYWVRAHKDHSEIAFWNGKFWRGDAWEGGNLHVDVVSERIPEPPSTRGH